MVFPRGLVTTTGTHVEHVVNGVTHNQTVGFVTVHVNQTVVAVNGFGDTVVTVGVRTCVGFVVKHNGVNVVVKQQPTVCSEPQPGVVVGGPGGPVNVFVPTGLFGKQNVKHS